VNVLVESKDQLGLMQLIFFEKIGSKKDWHLTNPITNRIWIINL
jgi:hypothetical protein